ncbi:acetyltransferase [Paenibacillus sp. PL2-23]|uniref:acyltransferase n=1 Tax=Paenibacillus sp. PL2-23 TaxID=2100729 RepID=UPI0030F4D0C3
MQLALFREFLTRSKGFIQVGRKATSTKGIVRVNGKVSVVNKGTLNIGSNLIMNGERIGSSVVVFQQAELTIHDNVFINYGFDIGCTKKITIGKNTIIGPLVNIIDSNFHSVDANDEISCKEINIGRNVWISRGVVILPGVTIGDNSVIGAGSVVTKDIPPNVLAAGIPATTIKELTPPPKRWLRKYLYS